MTKTSKSFDTLIPDIYSLFRDGHTTQEELSKRYGENVARNLSESLFGGDSHRSRIRLSGIGKPSRQLFYDLNDEPRERLAPNVLIKFQYGHILEEMFLYLAKEAGHEVIDEQRELELHGVKGHIDAIIDGVLVDVKSASPYGFLKFKDGSIRDNDGFHYIPQLAAYSQALGNIDSAFLAINKVTGEFASCKFSGEELAEVDVEGHIKRQRGVESSIRVPDRCYDEVPDGKSGNMALPLQCGYCKFKYRCWRDANNGQGLRTFIYSNKPRFLTKVERLPKVFEVGPPELYTPDPER